MIDPWYQEKFESKQIDLGRLLMDASGKQEETIGNTIAIIDSYLENEDKYEIIGEKDLKTKIKFEKSLHADIGMSAYGLISETKESTPLDTDYSKYPKISMKDAKLLELMNSFFTAALDRELYETFRRMFDNRKEAVSLNSMNFDNVLGEAIFLEYYKSVYIRLRRQHDVRDATNLAHEYGHGIQYMTNYHINMFNDTSVFSEIVSTFFEILMADYLKTIPEFKNDASKLQVRALNNCILSSNRIILERDMLGSIYKLDKIPEKVLKRKINEKIKRHPEAFMESGASELLNSIVAGEAKYVIGFVFALEIFMVYVKNKQAGLSLLKRVMDVNLNCSQEKYFKKLLSLGILPNKSFEEYKRYVKTPNNGAFHK